MIIIVMKIDSVYYYIQHLRCAQGHIVEGSQEAHGWALYMSEAREAILHTSTTNIVQVLLCTKYT